MRTPTLSILSLVTAFLSAPVQATSGEACAFRTELLTAVAEARDQGKPRAQVKQKIGELAAMGSASTRASAGEWVDLVYDDMKKMSPEKVGRMVMAACLRE